MKLQIEKRKKAGKGRRLYVIKIKESNGRWMKERIRREPVELSREEERGTGKEMNEKMSMGVVGKRMRRKNAIRYHLSDLERRKQAEGIQLFAKDLIRGCK